MRKPKPRSFADISPCVNVDAMPRAIVLYAQLDDANVTHKRPIYCRMTIEEATRFRDWLTLTIDKAKG